MTSKHVPEKGDGETRELGRTSQAPKHKKYGRLAAASMGSPPGVAGITGASAAPRIEIERLRANEAIVRRLGDYRWKNDLLGVALVDVVDNVEQIRPEAQSRLNAG